MMPRQMIQWRIYVYANSLYSLPGQEVRGFREWSPQFYSHSPYDVHRVMNWVNRDVSVMLRTKSEVFAVFELIMDMLPLLSMRSAEFKEALTKHLGNKTFHFVHELINFARSPYENMIAYECNVQYKALREEDFDGPSTSAEARRLGQFLSPGLHNFVEFSRRINPDDCGGFEADLQLEDEDVEALDDLMLERNDAALMMMAIDQSMLESRSVARSVARHQAAVAAARASSGADGQQQQQQQQQAVPGEQPAAGTVGLSRHRDFVNYELQMAIERSMMDEFGAELIPPPSSSGSRTVVVSNRQARNLMAANLFQIVQGTGGTAATGGTGGAAAAGAAGAGAAAAGTAGAGAAAAARAGAGGAAAEAGSAGGAAGAVAVNMANQNANNSALRARIRPRLRLRQRH